MSIPQFCYEEIQKMTAKTETEKLKFEVAKLTKQNTKLAQDYEVLQNCRSADHITLQGFQKRIVEQQREIASLQALVNELASHLNPVEVA